MTHLPAMAARASVELAAGWRTTPGVGLEKGRRGQESHNGRLKIRLKVIARIRRRATMSLPRWKRVHQNNRRKVADASAWTSKEKDCNKLRMDPTARMGVLQCVQQWQAYRRRNNHQRPTGPDPWRGGGALLGACEVKKKKEAGGLEGDDKGDYCKSVMRSTTTKLEQPTTDCSKHEPATEDRRAKAESAVVGCVQQGCLNWRRQRPQTTIHNSQAGGGSRAKQGQWDGMGGWLRSRVGMSRLESNRGRFIELTSEGATPALR
jgi:hypothetical protein